MKASSLRRFNIIAIGDCKLTRYFLINLPDWIKEGLFISSYSLGENDLGQRESYPGRLAKLFLTV